MEPDRSNARSRPRRVRAASLALVLVGSGTVVVASEYRAPAADAAAPRAAASAAPIVSMAAAPVAPKCWYYDSWQAPRVGGRFHEGVDIGAALGQPVYAVATGTITGQYVDAPGLRAGNALRLRQADTTYFFYAHMQGFADGIAVGSRVQAGDVIGYVGQTGNALSPHLHFEIHPNGGAAINPFPSMKAMNICSGNVASPSAAPVPEPTPPRRRQRRRRPMRRHRSPAAVPPSSALPSGSA